MYGGRETSPVLKMSLSISLSPVDESNRITTLPASGPPTTSPFRSSPNSRRTPGLSAALPTSARHSPVPSLSSRRISTFPPLPSLRPLMRPGKTLELFTTRHSPFLKRPGRSLKTWCEIVPVARCHQQAAHVAYFGGLLSDEFIR